MEPMQVLTRKGKEVILFSCKKCQTVKTNVVSSDDNTDALIDLAKEAALRRYAHHLNNSEV